MKTITEIKETMKLHHTAACRGYVSRKSEGIVKEYDGKFGKGYVILRPRFDTTKYVYCDYYIAD